MSKLKNIIAVGASALMLSGVAAGTASAQQWRNYDRGYNNDYDGGRLTTSYVDSLEWRINNAAQEGRISWGEARNLMREFRQVQPLAYRVQTGEASRWEYNRLATTVDRIERATQQYASNRRYNRYGYNNRW